MPPIVIVDTSVLLNVLAVPGFSQDRDTVLDRFGELVDAGASILLPLGAVFETGNHIADVPDGRQRRRYAAAFTDQVRQALKREAPWTLAPLPDADHPVRIFSTVTVFGSLPGETISSRSSVQRGRPATSRERAGGGTAGGLTACRDAPLSWKASRVVVPTRTCVTHAAPRFALSGLSGASAGGEMTPTIVPSQSIVSQ